MELRVVEVDKITSGKKVIFSFVRKGRQIDTTPFQLKKRDEEYGYHHHPK